MMIKEEYILGIYYKTRHNFFEKKKQVNLTFNLSHKSTGQYVIEFSHNCSYRYCSRGSDPYNRHTAPFFWSRGWKDERTGVK